MKKLITLFLAAAMLLTMTACGAAEPVQTAPATTKAPTTAPTEEPTEAPSQPRELTEEEKKQLYYEQVFSEGSYTMDWSCVTIDISANLNHNEGCHIEVFSDENGVFWESIRPLKEDPCYYERLQQDNYYRRDAQTAYYYINDSQGPRTFCVDTYSENKGNAVTTIWNKAQTVFSEVSSKQDKVVYMGTEDGMDIVLINPCATELLFFYIAPDTCEVKKLYIKTVEYNYCAEFVDKSVGDITIFDNLPFAVTEKITYTGIQDNRAKMANLLLHDHVCKTDSGKWPAPFGVELPKIEKAETENVIADKLLKWEKIFAEQTYVIDWSSVTIMDWSPVDGNWADISYSHRIARLTDEHGVWWEKFSIDNHSHDTYYYRADDNTAYFNVRTPETGDNWYLVNTSSPQVKNKAEEYFDRAQLDMDWAESLEYTKSVNGLDVIKGKFGNYATIELHINPVTYEIKYIYTTFVMSGAMPQKTEIEFIYEDRIYIHMEPPEQTKGAIQFFDIAEYQNMVWEEWAHHGQ